MNLVDKAKRALAEAEVRFNEAFEAVETADEGIEADELEVLNTALDEAESDVVRKRSEVERLERIYKAREESRAVSTPEPEIKNTSKSMTTYRKDGRNSFFADLVAARRGDFEAMKRLQTHAAELRDLQNASAEMRADVTSGAGSGAGFVPPIWLGDEWAELARPGRPFADVVPTYPMPPAGLTSHIPRVTVGSTEAVQNGENTSVSDNSGSFATATSDANLVSIAGQINMSRQVLERSYPGLDMVVFADLVRAYNSQLDAQLISGSGSNGQHLGLANVSGINTVTYTDGTPAGEKLLQAVYKAVDLIASNRYEEPNLILMHPRRAAWLAATQASSFPLFQQGGLFHAAGQQDGGFAGSMAGLNVVTDANIPTNVGASTNQDDVYVLYIDDLRLAEGDVRTMQFEEVLSDKLEIRLQAFGYSFFHGDRQPKSIARIRGTGLVPPSYDATIS